MNENVGPPAGWDSSLSVARGYYSVGGSVRCSKTKQSHHERGLARIKTMTE